METVFVKPKKDLLVRSPRTKTLLPKEGATVPWIGADGRYWRRRVRDGDVELVASEKKKEFYTKKEVKENDNII